jgi:DNA-binding MarR family transcriptional regulator
VILLELQRATHATLHLLTGALAELSLTPSEINALANLADGEPRTVSDLGAAVGAKPATVTGILDRLERRGLINRSVRQGDRRAVLIALTSSGVEAARTVHAAFDDCERRALSGLSDESVAAARAVLRALTSAAAR